MLFVKDFVAHLGLALTKLLGHLARHGPLDQRSLGQLSGSSKHSMHRTSGSWRDAAALFMLFEDGAAAAPHAAPCAHPEPARTGAGGIRHRQSGNGADGNGTSGTDGPAAGDQMARGEARHKADAIADTKTDAY